MCFDSLELGPVISVRGLHKEFSLEPTPIKQMLALLDIAKTSGRTFKALDDVSFDIKRGETVAIIGRNGSGKSTLLQLITGTLTPTGGSISVNGRVAALLELGSGFNHEFTGRENVYLNASLYGLTRSQIDERIESILAFAQIDDFVDLPVRSYSSGMVVRLAFAVIAHIDADILIVDEALSVGDAFFSQKCMRFLRDFQKRGTLLFVSHDHAAVTSLCQRAIWLDKGKVREIGEAKSVVESYLAWTHADQRAVLADDTVKVEKTGFKNIDDVDPRHELEAFRPRMRTFSFDPDAVVSEFGSGKLRIVEVRIYGEREQLSLIEGGELVTLEFDIEANESVADVIVGFYLKDRLGQRLFGDNSYEVYSEDPVNVMAGDKLRARFCFRMPVLPSGDYLFDIAVASGTQEDHTQHHWLHDALRLHAIDETQRHGLVGIPMHKISMEVFQ